MFDKWIIQLVISFVLRQIAKFGRTVNWDLVKADADMRVRALVPGEWLDDEASALVQFVIECVRTALASDSDLERIIKHLVAGERTQAFDAVKDLLGKIWMPNNKAAGRFAIAFDSMKAVA